MIYENERYDLIQKNGYGVIQNEQWFSYGIDAVLVSHFAKIKKGSKVIDLGTGTGIIPLLINLKSQAAKIYGIEKQTEVAEMAKRSVLHNKIEQIEIIQTDILDVFKHIPKACADVVISNPPYFQKGDALTNDGSIKSLSRHESTADLETFIKVTSNLLKEKGCFYMVHRPMRLVDIFSYARKYNLEPKEIQFIYPNLKKPPNIVLIKCVKNGNRELRYLDNLYVYDDNQNYSESIKSIYKSLNIDVF